MPDLENTLIAIQEALDAGDALAAGKAYAKAGQVCLERNLYQDAARYYRESSNHFQAAGEQPLLAKSLNHLGICLVMEKDPESALELLEEALHLVEACADPALESAIQGNIGLAYNAAGNHQKAFQAHKQVLESAEDRGDQPLRLNALINLADSSLQQKNTTSAQGFALVALDLAKSIDNYAGLALIYDLLGMISSRQGNLKDAAEYHQQAYLEAEKNDDLLRQGIALANKGLALEGLTEMEGALTAMSQAAELFTLLNSDYLEKTQRDIQRVREGMT